MSRVPKDRKNCADDFCTVFLFVSYRNKQDILASKCHLLGEPKTLLTDLKEVIL